MAAPSFFAASIGVVVTTGSGTVVVSATGASQGAVGDFFILHVMQDGTGSGPSLSAGAQGTFEALDGTNDTMTSLSGNPFAVGSPTAAGQYIYLGRIAALGGSGGDLFLTLTTAGDDLYAVSYIFKDVNTGTTVSAVIENSSAGSAVNGVGTSATVADTGVTTLGADRLACNFIGVNDDNNLDLTSMTGETGGDWTYPVTAFGSATGTDGAVALVTATIASAGTINGGTDGMAASDAWGVVGFALIPAAAAVPASLVDRRRVQYVHVRR